ncbi:hypothetical protein DAPPUDRAFT_266026 [Daphnia pulex]|uniref:Uncharacterized protein n=1 Tax=Daphnia pulex TaxID=6669 RepID=E9HUD4_DAPPU|nr:hypothetical protein DAPPUDRAFT_266026 [Daphnia pulex]|eukprot:EFX64648.1 hypothetical protein DAPPUDRAFT_266026 [Daphnia pulex]
MPAFIPVSFTINPTYKNTKSVVDKIQNLIHYQANIYKHQHNMLAHPGIPIDYDCVDSQDALVNINNLELYLEFTTTDTTTENWDKKRIRRSDDWYPPEKIRKLSELPHDPEYDESQSTDHVLIDEHSSLMLHLPSLKRSHAILAGSSISSSRVVASTAAAATTAQSSHQQPPEAESSRQSVNQPSRQSSTTPDKYPDSNDERSPSKTTTPESSPLHRISPYLKPKSTTTTKIATIPSQPTTDTYLIIRQSSENSIAKLSTEVDSLTRGQPSRRTKEKSLKILNLEKQITIHKSEIAKADAAQQQKLIYNKPTSTTLFLQHRLRKTKTY